MRRAVRPIGRIPPLRDDALNAAFHEALAVPETRARLATFDGEVKIGTPEELGKMLADERAKWSKVVKEANIKVE